MDVASDLTDRFRGALLGALVGDCLGAPFEGSAAPVPPSALDAVLESEGRLRFTDDTALMVAVCESLVSVGSVDLDDLAARMAAAHAAEPWRGYGAGAAALLAQVAAGAGWERLSRGQFGGRGSFGNGAAMRVAPVGLLARGNPGRAAQLARLTALPTHFHDDAADGAAAQAAAVAVLSNSDPAALRVAAVLDDVLAVAGNLAEPLERVRRCSLTGSLDIAWVRREVGCGIRAVEAVPAGIACFAAFPQSFERALAMAVGLGGDTDTIAAMTGALSGALWGEDAIPRRWLARCEGVDGVRNLADRLASAVESGLR